MATPVSRLTHIITIGPIPIILDITLIALTGDGAVIGDINIAITTISIGVTIDQVIITKNTTMAINEVINEIATVDTKETIIGRVAMDANGDGKLIVRTGGSMGRAN